MTYSTFDSAQTKFGSHYHSESEVRLQLYLVFKSRRRKYVWLIKYSFVPVHHAYISNKKFIFFNDEFAAVRVKDKILSVKDIRKRK